MILFPQLVRQRVVQLLRQQLKGVLHRRPDLPGGEPGRGRIDGLNGQLFCLGDKLWGEHFPPEKGAGHLAPEQVSLPLPQQGGNVAVVEKSQDQVALPVGDAGFVQELSPADPLFRRPLENGALHHSHLSQHGFPHWGVYAPVLIGPGV